MFGYEKIGMLCSKLERISELEKLMTGEDQNPIVNEVMFSCYQEEHNRLVKSVNDYLAKNYPDGSFAVVVDIWQYMQEQQREKVGEAVLIQSELMAREKEVQSKRDKEYKEIVEQFVKNLRDLSARLS